ncbi:hypothetical protein GVAV_001995 [Gurleya vavrai]
MSEIICLLKEKRKKLANLKFLSYKMSINAYKKCGYFDDIINSENFQEIALKNYSKNDSHFYLTLSTHESRHSDYSIFFYYYECYYNEFELFHSENRKVFETSLIKEIKINKQAINVIEPEILRKIITSTFSKIHYKLLFGLLININSNQPIIFGLIAYFLLFDNHIKYAIENKITESDKKIIGILFMDNFKKKNIVEFLKNADVICTFDFNAKLEKLLVHLNLLEATKIYCIVFQNFFNEYLDKFRQILKINNRIYMGYQIFSFPLNKKF